MKSRAFEREFDIRCSGCMSLHCSLLKHCSSEWVSFIDQHKTCLLYKKGQQVIYEGMPVDNMYFIQSGKAKIYKKGVTNREQIIRLAKDGDILGHRGFHKKHYPISASVLEDSRICIIAIQNFEKAIQSNKSLAYDLMVFYADELNRAEDRARNLAQMTVREKVADTLLWIYETIGVDVKNDYLDIILSRQELADIMGIAKGQVSKCLNDFHAEKYLTIEGKRIGGLDIDALTSIAQANYSIYTG